MGFKKKGKKKKKTHFCGVSDTGCVGKDSMAMVAVRRRSAKELLEFAKAISRRANLGAQIGKFEIERPILPTTRRFTHSWGSSNFSKSGVGLPPRNSRGLASITSAEPPLPWYGRYIGYSILLTGSAILTYYYYPHPGRGPRATHRQSPPPDEHTISNWSGTHEATTRVYAQPESLAELEELVKLANEKKQRIRPVGSGLSPNGIGLSDEGMVNLALMDRVLSVDEESKRVRVQAGARVAEVVEALRPHGLTLQNYASIREQQIGGFIQVKFLSNKPAWIFIAYDYFLWWILNILWVSDGEKEGDDFGVVDFELV